MPLKRFGGGEAKQVPSVFAAGKMRPYGRGSKRGLGNVTDVSPVTGSRISSHPSGRSFCLRRKLDGQVPAVFAPGRCSVSCFGRKGSFRPGRSLLEKLSCNKKFLDNRPAVRYNKHRCRQRRFSSSGRAPPCQGGGSEFEPRNLLQFKTTRIGWFFFFAAEKIRGAERRSKFPRFLPQAKCCP